MKTSHKIGLLVLMFAVVLTLTACGGGEEGPIFEQPIGVDRGVGWFQAIVGFFAMLVGWTSELAGGQFIVGLIAITLLIRLVGWPIYAKTNNLTTNMSLAQPDMEKLKEKYRGKTDQASQRAMQQEMMQIYKEYGVNPLGCLLPLLQMPIFIAMYQTVRRIPITPDYANLDYQFLWFDFQAEPAGFALESWPFALMALLVGVTMFFYQRYAMAKPDILQNKRYRTPQQIQQEKTMKYVSYFMVIMLVAIAYTNLGIAFYWLIGNMLQFLQTYLARKKTIERVKARRNLV